MLSILLAILLSPVEPGTHGIRAKDFLPKDEVDISGIYYVEGQLETKKYYGVSTVQYISKGQYLYTSTVGGIQVKGIAIREGNNLSAAWSSGGDITPGVSSFSIGINGDNISLQGHWASGTGKASEKGRRVAKFPVLRLDEE